MLTMNVQSANATVEKKELLTAGRVGLEVEYNFSDDWAELSKVAVFEGCATRSNVLDSTNRTTVPSEVLAEEGYVLRLGVYGMDASGNIVIPTVWAKAGKIWPGAYPEDPYIELEPGVAAECIAKANEAIEKASAVFDAAERGDFNGEPGPKGDNYVLTEMDKQEIADIVYQMIVNNGG